VYWITLARDRGKREREREREETSSKCRQLFTNVHGVTFESFFEKYGSGALRIKCLDKKYVIIHLDNSEVR
jgi:hypothetical protein